MRPLEADPTSFDVSLIVTESDVATIVPVIELLLISSWNISIDSVERSAAIVLVIVPVLLFTVKEPLRAASLKSDADIVPDTCKAVQYNTVPFGTPAVVTVKVTVDHSLTDVVDGIAE